VVTGQGDCILVKRRRWCSGGVGAAVDRDPPESPEGGRNGPTSQRHGKVRLDGANHDETRAHAPMNPDMTDVTTGFVNYSHQDSRRGHSLCECGLAITERDYFGVYQPN